MSLGSDARGSQQATQPRSTNGLHSFKFIGRKPTRWLFSPVEISIDDSSSEPRSTTSTMATESYLNPQTPLTWLFFNSANTTSSVHPFTVPGHRSVICLGQLEWIAALKLNFGFSADRSTLSFWTPLHPLKADDVGMDWLRENTEIEEVARRCQPTDFINEILGGSWDTKLVHFLIMADKLEEGTGRIPAEKQSSLNALHSYLRNARMPIRLPTPAEEYAESQGREETAIYDGYFQRDQPVNTTALPVQVFHPVFQEFLDRINDPTFEPDIATIIAVSRLMAANMEIHPSETDRFGALRPLFTDLLGKDVGQMPSECSHTSGGLVSKQIDGSCVPLVCLEYKHTLDGGEYDYDPSVQAAYSVRELLTLNKFKPILEKSCCPCFLLSGSGSCLSILGVVFPNKLIVQPLTDANWVGEATRLEERRIYRLAQVFRALRLAIVTLDEYYGQVSKDRDIPERKGNKPHPRLFPYPTRFLEYAIEASERKRIDFEYIDLPRTDPANITFIVKVKSSDRKLVIKFVERYGVEAHDHLASEGMAPRLLYCGLLDGENDARDGEGRARGSIQGGGLYVGPLRMVVMDYIEGSTLDKTPHPLKNTRAQIEKAVKTLHNRRLVLGSLRAPNIMISENKVYITHFDWSGKVNEARYPLHLPKSVKWPKEPKKLELGPILADHDLFMLEQLF